MGANAEASEIDGRLVIRRENTMTLAAGILVLLGAAILATASEVIEDLFLAGIISRHCRRVAPGWMRYSILALVVGTGFIVAGISLLHAGT